jgi:LacI family transcriptional regulator
VEQGRPRRPTVADVARRAEVSVATAGRALGGYGYVSEDTRSRVEAAAQELGYSPNVVARSMRSGSTRSIGFVGSDIADPYFAEAMRGICDVAHREGYETILTNSDERLDLEQLAVRTLLDKQVEGLVVAPSSVTHFSHLEEARDQGVPVVLLDRDLPQLGFDSVVVDNEQAAYEAVLHLLSLGLVASVSASERPEVRPADGDGSWTVVGADRPSVERIRGYLRALASHGAPVTAEAITLFPSERASHADTTARRLLQSGWQPTAVFATDNEATRRMFLAAKAEGVKIPDQVSLLGFDDADWTAMVDPPLTVVAQSPMQMGSVAGERLFARIKGDSEAKRRIVQPTRLIIRGSTGMCSESSWTGE